MPKRVPMLHILLLILSFFHLAQAQNVQDCTKGTCSGIGPPQGVCKPSDGPYSQVDSPGTLWTCSGLPPVWTTASSLDTQARTLANTAQNMATTANTNAATALTMAQAAVPGQVPTTYSSTTAYPRFAIVTASNNNQYISLVASNTGNDPTAANSTFWGLWSKAGAATTIPGTAGTITTADGNGNPVAAPSASLVNGKITTAMSVFKGPRIDVTHPDFAGGAKSGVASDAAINAAIAFAGNLASAGNTPVVYFPHGNYPHAHAFRVPCNISIQSDDAASADITITSATENNITVLPAGSPNTPASGSANGQTCGGSISNITLDGIGKAGTGTLLEVTQVTGYSSNNLHVFNGGGRGINFEGSTERAKFFNTRIDAVRWPLQMTHNSNENHFYGLLIDAPGQDNSGYCWGAMCVNGQYPIFAPSTPAITSVSRAASGVITYTMAGQVPYGLQVGHYVNVTGITGDSTLNVALGQITAESNTTASAYTISVASSATTASGPFASQGTLSIVWRPDIHNAVWLEGVNNHLQGGSLKGTLDIGGVQMVSTEDNSFDESYIEGFPYNGEARLNTAVSWGGVMPLTGTTAATTANSMTAIPVLSAAWFPDYIGDVQDIANCANYYYVMSPADAIAGSNVTSVAFPSVTKGTTEVVSGCFSSDQAFHFTGRGQNGTTSQAWPSGSNLERGASSAYSYSAFERNHANSIQPPTVAGFVTDCNDQTFLTGRTQDDYPIGYTLCAEAIGSIVPDTILTSAPGATLGAQAGYFSTQNPLLSGNAIYTTSTPESLGGGWIKSFGQSTVNTTDQSKSAYVSLTDWTNGATTSTLVGGFYPAEIHLGTPANGYQGIGNINSPNLKTYSALGSGNQQTFHLDVTTGVNSNGVEPFNPGVQYVTDFEEFMSSKCWGDMVASGSHASMEFCIEGSPAVTGGLQGAFLYDQTGTAVASMTVNSIFHNKQIQAPLFIGTSIPGFLYSQPTTTTAVQLTTANRNVEVATYNSPANYILPVCSSTSGNWQIDFSRMESGTNGVTVALNSSKPNGGSWEGWNQNAPSAATSIALIPGARWTVTCGYGTFGNYGNVLIHDYHGGPSAAVTTAIGTGAGAGSTITAAASSNNLSGMLTLTIAAATTAGTSTTASPLATLTYTSYDFGRNQCSLKALDFTTAAALPNLYAGPIVAGSNGVYTSTIYNGPSSIAPATLNLGYTCN